ncbi:YkvA family protein [Acidobacteriota bacterium]
MNKKIGRWTDKFMQYLLVLPDLVHLMIKLFVDRGTPARFKGYIVIAFTYLISPIDIIPDFIPVAGFIDDLLVLVIILNKIINSADEIVLVRIKSLWAGEDDVFDKVKEIIETMNILTSEIPRSIHNFMKNEE